MGAYFEVGDTHAGVGGLEDLDESDEFVEVAREDGELVGQLVVLAGFERLDLLEVLLEPEVEAV